MASTVRLLWFTSTIMTVCGDVYLHNPRGSNNRLDEENRERANANRMFDSQNNNRGGYNVGSLYYYEASDIPIEWTNQHSCGAPNAHCELVIQYLCSDYVRDGVTTTTIPENQVLCDNYDCNTDTQYGMHETFDSYVACKKRERNLGLFTADQNTANGNNRRTAKYTRQNPNGNRFAYECPEERDYYPYWHRSGWRDIAILTNNATRCPFYQAESENVKGRWECVLPYEKVLENVNDDSFVIPNNKEDCDAFTFPDDATVKGVWTFFEPHGIDAPVCRETQFSRDNHLGNGMGGYPNLFNWTVPAGVYHERCALRVRYNISTGEFNGWDGTTNASLNAPRRNQATLLDMSERFGFEDSDAAAQRGYEFEGNPQVELFEDANNLKLRLAVNTAQYGRTFEDRSFTFELRQRPADMGGAPIYNLNVRGKRGNIVQVYPGVEYDYVPNTLKVSPNDYIHYQWTGSNTNPRNNDGQGLAGTDRTNVVLQAGSLYEPLSTIAYPNGKNGHWGRSYPDHLTNTSLMELTLPDKRHLALLTTNQFRGEMSELDDAGTYFDLGPRKATTVGTSHYMCTRNNNFSNRSQKGKIVCSDVRSSVRAIGWNGGKLVVGDSDIELDVQRGSFQSLTMLEVEKFSVSEGERYIKAKGHNFDAGDYYASDFVFISPQGVLTTNGMKIKVRVQLYEDAPSDPVLYYSNENNFGQWNTINDFKMTDDQVMEFSTAEGGVFVARGHSKAGLIAGVVIAVIVLIAVVVGGTFWYCRRNPSAMDSVRNIGRSTQKKV